VYIQDDDIAFENDTLADQEQVGDAVRTKHEILAKQLRFWTQNSKDY
jgi:hypothetical protein